MNKDKQEALKRVFSKLMDNLEDFLPEYECTFDECSTKCPQYDECEINGDVQEEVEKAEHAIMHL